MMKNAKKFWKRILKKYFKEKENMMGAGDISGTWFNPKTGQKVIARQIITDGNDTLVQTDQGMFNMMQFSDFVQMGDEIFDEDGNSTGQKASESIEEVFSTYEQEKPSFDLTKPLTQQNSNNTIKTEQKSSTVEIVTKDVNTEIIERAFAKIDGKPRIQSIDIDWDGMPLDKIQNAIELLDLSVSDVADYIFDKYFKSTNLIKNKIIEAILQK